MRAHEPPPAERWLVECTDTLSSGRYGGIQRYVRRSLRAAARLLGGQRVAALHVRGGTWHTCTDWPAHALEEPAALSLDARSAVFDASTQVLLADRLWHADAEAPLQALLSSPARVGVVVYDLLSLRHPEWFPPAVPVRFARYLQQVLPRAQTVVCLTQAVATEVVAWAQAQCLRCPTPVVVAPGHDVVPQAAESSPLRLPAPWRDGRQPFVLQVGTLEPRKNHALTLALMQHCWRSGSPLGLLVIGQPGWLTTDLQEQLQQAAATQAVQWLPDAPDGVLAWCYQHAKAVLYPSADEGYGLPLAEALAAGARVVATDTPVHREVATPWVEAGAPVRLCEPTVDALHDALLGVLNQPKCVNAHAVALRTWDAATAELLQALAVHPLVCRT